MFKRAIALILLLAMCLSVLPLGVVAYAEESASDALPGESHICGEETDDTYQKSEVYGIVGNYTPFGDKKLIEVLGLDKMDNSEKELSCLLTQWHNVLDSIAKGEGVCEGKDTYVKWENSHGFPIFYTAPADGQPPEEYAHNKDMEYAFRYMGNYHPLFGYDVTRVKIECDDSGLLKSVKFYYTPGIALETRREFLKQTDAMIELFGQMRKANNRGGELTDEQVVLLVNDYFVSNAHYDAPSARRFSAQGTVVDHRSVCDGQAQAVCYVLKNIGIPCTMAASHENMMHAWNIVTINGKRYHLCTTSSDTKIKGENDHSYMLMSTWEYIMRRVGKENIAQNPNATELKAYYKYMSAFIGDYFTREFMSKESIEQLETLSEEEKELALRYGFVIVEDAAEDKSYEEAFLTTVGSGFVLYGNDLLFISKNGELCLWKGGKSLPTVEKTSDGKLIGHGYTVLKNKDGNDRLPGLWPETVENQYVGFHKISAGNWYADPTTRESKKTEPKDGEPANLVPYYFSDNAGIYELYLYSDMSYSYKEAHTPELMKEGQHIYDFCINDGEYYINVSDCFANVDNEYGRHLYHDTTAKNVLERAIPMTYNYKFEEEVSKHIIGVKRSDLEGYSLDSWEYYMAYFQEQGTVGASDLRWLGEVRDTVEATESENGEYYYLEIVNPGDAIRKENINKGFKISPITVTLHLTDNAGEVHETKPVILNENKLDVKLRHEYSLDGSNEIRYYVEKDALSGYDSDSIYLLCEIPNYIDEKGKKSELMRGTKTRRLEPQEVGEYYYFILTDLADEREYEIRSVLFATKDGQTYHSPEDSFAVTAYETVIGGKIGHTLDLASDISVNFIIRKSELDGFDTDTMYLLADVDRGEGANDRIHILPDDRGSYYYFTVSGLTAVNMNDEIRAVFHGVKDGKEYYSSVDHYSIAQYAYSQMGGTLASEKLKKLCAELLRYGSYAQIYKNYRTDHLADSAMDDTQRGYLSDLEAVTFGSHNVQLDDRPESAILWKGKALDLNSKICVKFIFAMDNYDGDVSELTLRVSYTDVYGAKKELTLSNAELYNPESHYYAFVMDRLLAAELRTVVSVRAYAGETPVSSTMQYSADTYGNNKSGALGQLCKALFAYSDMAKEFFSAK